VVVRVFEQSHVVGGRCSTRLWQGHLVDVGVQYFTAQSPEFKKELLTRLRQFRPIISHILDRNDSPVTSPTGPRFYVLQGNNYLAHILSSGLDMRLDTSVDTVSFRDQGVDCLGEHYQAVVSSLPGPKTARLFSLAQPPAEYEPCIIALVEYNESGLGQSRECYARLLPEGKQAIGSSYCENHKAGRIIGNKTVFIVQATPRFSREHADAPPETYLPLLIRENEEIWQISSGGCTASFAQTWFYGRPLHDHRHRVDLPPGGFICGDSRTDSTVENVWIDGRRAASEVLAYLTETGA
jgi:predicted NAD/FAD-dependent oxidoreductase